MADINLKVVNLDEKLRAIIDQSFDVFIEIDCNCTVLEWNTKAEILFDRSRNEVVGKKLSDTITSSLFGESGEKLKDFQINGQSPLVNKKTNIWIDSLKEELPVAISTFQLFSGNSRGTEKTLGIYIHNLREQTVSAQNLFGSEERFGLLISAVKDYAIIMLDHTGKVIIWNEGARRIYGYSPEEIIGKDQSTFYTPEDKRKNMPQEAMRIASDIGHYEKEEWRVRKNNTQFLANITITPIYDNLNQLTGFAKIVRDITAQKVSERRRIELVEAERSNIELDQFASMASHDIQEPLRAITGCLQVIEKTYKGKLDSAADELIHYALDGAMHLRALIGDLLSLSKLDGGETVFKKTDLSTLLEQTLISLAAPIAESHAKITYDPMPSLTVESSQLTQVFQNLISNALKFRSEKSPEIHIGVRKGERYWQFSVHDNGIGFKQEFAERIFEPFKRLHTREKYSGSGLGLTLCKRVIERLGGTIWVESEPGQGTTFYFTIKDTDET